VASLLVPLVLLLAMATVRVTSVYWSPLLDGPLGPGTARLAERLAGAAVWLAAAFLLVRALDCLVWSRRTPALPRLLTDLVAAAIWLATVLVIAGFMLEMPLTGILTTSGVAVAVLGFALRDILASLFAGIALNFERPYRIGDWLEVGPELTGRVTEIGPMTTRLVTLDNIAVVVPNARLATQGLRNFNQGAGGIWRDCINLTLGYEVSPVRGERILLAAAASVQGANAAGRRPDARITALSEQGVVWQLRYWLADYARRTEIRHEVHAALLLHLYRGGLAPAHRRLDLFHAPMPDRTIDRATHLDRLLGRSELFGTLAEEDLHAVASAAHRRLVPAGAVVIREGEAGQSLFVIVEGLLEVAFVRDRPDLTRMLGPGELLGEYSLLTGAPRSATVTARTQCVLYEIDKAALLPVLARNPEIAESFSAVLQRREADRASPVAPAALPATAGHDDRPGLAARMLAFFGLEQRP
jgi:small-conductance mechanosensitive channel